MEKIKDIFKHLSIRNFIEYYDVFERYKDSYSNEKIIEAFRLKPESWTEKACSSRASKGKDIFKLNMELEALRYVMNSANSKKISIDIKEKAYQIYFARQDIPNSLLQVQSDKSLAEQILIDTELGLIEENSQLSKEEKLALIKIRFGQSSYRSNLINLWGGCSITGCENVNILIASHIKPYRDCNRVERYDKFNGLLLTPNYDKLFDSYLISFDNEGKILISENLSSGDLIKLNISKHDKIRILQSEHLNYLKHHRKLFNEHIKRG